MWTFSILCFFVLMRTSLGVDEVTTMKNETQIKKNATERYGSTVGPLVLSDGDQTIESGNRVGNTTQSSKCRNITVEFKRYWIYGQLESYLKKLKASNCQEFKEECANRTYNFTIYTQLCYDRLCDEATFWNRCRDELRKLTSVSLRRENRAPIIIDEVRRVQSSLSLDDMLKPCVQVALIDEEFPGDNNYWEITENQFPFCGQIWCGFSKDAVTKYGISEWTCAPDTCRTNIIVVMVTVGLLAILVTAANVTVLFVFAKNRRLRDSQGIYKMSLAVADALVGMVVLPTTIETMRLAYQPTYRNVTENNSTIFEKQSFYSAYRGFAGFCTTLCLSGSIYLLMVASFDRFMVVFHPLRYNLHTAKSLAIKLSIIVWILVVVFSLTPFIFEQVVYQKVTSIFICISTADEDGIYIILACGFAIPLVVVWIVNVATFVFSKRNARARPKIITPNSQVRSVNVENRLAKTLSIMVLAFTACLLPLVLVTLAHFFVDGIDLGEPAKLNQGTSTAINSIELVSVIILLSNSLWNFFIYNVRSMEFRKSYRALFKSAKATLKSKLFRDSAKEARNRRTSAIPSQSSQVQWTNASVVNL